MSNHFYAVCYISGPEGLHNGDHPAESTRSECLSKMERRNWFIMIQHRSLVYLLAVTRLASSPSLVAFAQDSESAWKFELADVRASAHHDITEVSGGLMRGGRYLLRHATMLELVRLAYDVDAKKVLGGPNWIELDRFDIRAGTTSTSVKPMLRVLLAERFGLVAHRDTKPSRWGR